MTKISVPDAKAWMKMGISWQCGPDDSVWLQNFTHTPFKFSYMDNKIVVVGYETNMAPFMPFRMILVID